MNNELTNKPSESESIRAFLEPLVPLAKDLITNQQKELALRETQIQKQAEYDIKALDFDTHNLDFDRHKFDRQFLLLMVIVLFICGLSAGIIFYIKDIHAGLLVLSHLGAIIAGLIAGIGYEKSKREKEELISEE
jgi:hypothetical protein